MLRGVSRRAWRYFILFVLLLSPSIFFVGTYAVNSYTHPNQVSKYTAVSSDGNWSISLTISNPSYVLSGQSVPINYNLQVQFSQPYVAMYVGLVGAEVRKPISINSTTNVVSGWSALVSNYGLANENLTSKGLVTRTFYIPVNYPLNDTIGDLLIPTRNVGVNGVANVTIYSLSGGTPTSTEFISLLDDQTAYVSQLSTVLSSVVWAVYQVVMAAIASVIFAITRTRLIMQVETSYSLEVESVRLRASLSALVELRNSGKLSEAKYKELKAGYEKELEAIQKKSPSPPAG